MRSFFAVIGHPVAHSLSPVFQQAAFDQAGIDAAYIPLDLDPVWADSSLTVLKNLGISGFNVTLPFKELAYRTVDRVEGIAAQIKSVNTVVLKNGDWEGYNTDVTGFVKAYSLFLNKKKSRSGKYLVLGAGGSARAVLMGLLSLEPTCVMVANRSPEKMEKLVSDFSGKMALFSSSLSDLPRTLTESGWHVINTLSRNAYPVPGSFPPLESIDPVKIDSLYDLSYDREQETECVRWGRERGILSSDGLSMLIFQGADSFEIWTGKKAPLEVMKESLRKVLPLKNLDDC